MSELSDELTCVLADAFTFYVRTHAAHWNVTGDEFAQFHELFGDIYQDVWESLDGIAENIRKIDAFPPSSIDELVEKREVRSPRGVVSDAQKLLAELVELNDGVIKCLNEAFSCANECNEQGVANFLADRLDKHQKWRWQMKASMEVEDEPVVPQPQKPAAKPPSSPKNVRPPRVS
jgi:starvation-inducible DNA-binding protein